MNARELRTLREAVKRFMPEASVVNVEELPASARIELPYQSVEGKSLYFFVARRKKASKFSIVLHVESIGILAVDSTLAMLQKLLHSYGLLLSQEGVIMEENMSIPLHKRLAAMAQVVFGIDGIRRLWKVEFERRNDATES